MNLPRPWRRFAVYFNQKREIIGGEKEVSHLWNKESPDPMTFVFQSLAKAAPEGAYGIQVFCTDAHKKRLIWTEERYR